MSGPAPSAQLALLLVLPALPLPVAEEPLPASAEAKMQGLAALHLSEGPAEVQQEVAA